MPRLGSKAGRNKIPSRSKKNEKMTTFSRSRSTVSDAKSLRSRRGETITSSASSCSTLRSNAAESIARNIRIAVQQQKNKAEKNMDVLPSRSFKSFDERANRSTDDLERSSRGFENLGENSLPKRPERPKSQPQYEKRRPRFTYQNSKNDLQILKSRKGTEFPGRVGCMSSSIQSQKSTLNYPGSVRSRKSASSRRTSPNKLRISPLNSAYSFSPQKSKLKSKFFQMANNVSTQKSVSDFNDVAGIASLLKSDSTSICSQKSGLLVPEHNPDQSYGIGNRSSGSFSAPKPDSVKPHDSDCKAHAPHERESNSVKLFAARLIGTNQEDFSEHCRGPFMPTDRHQENKLLVSTHSSASSAYSSSTSSTQNYPEGVYSKETEYTNIFFADEQSATNLHSAEIPRTIEIAAGLPEAGKLSLTEQFRYTLERTMLMKQAMRDAVYKEILCVQPCYDIGIPYCQCTDNGTGESQEAIEYINGNEDMQQHTNLDEKLGASKMENNRNSHGADSEERDPFHEVAEFGDRQNEREIEEAGSSYESSVSFLKSGTEESEIEKTGTQSSPNCHMLEGGKILEIYNILQTVVSTSTLHLGGEAVIVETWKEDEIASCEGTHNAPLKIDHREEDSSEKIPAHTEHRAGHRRAAEGRATRNNRCHTPVGDGSPDPSEMRYIRFVSPAAPVGRTPSVGPTAPEPHATDGGERTAHYPDDFMQSIHRFLGDRSAGCAGGERPHVTDPLCHVLDPIISNVGKNVEALIEKSAQLSSAPTIRNWEEHPLVSID